MEDKFGLSVPVCGPAMYSELSEEEKAYVQLKLWQFLGKQTERYTAGDSSSVRVETARELLSSIRFAIEEYFRATGSSPRRLLKEETDILFRGGLDVLKGKIKEGKRLWQAACMSAPDIENISYRDTLKGIGGFWKRYDYLFFAHMIPCDIDYQLCRPVADELQGVEYVNEYLRRIIIENAILRRYELDLVIRLLGHYCPDYKGLLINLCEPVIVNGVGLSLAGGNPLSLHITDAQRLRLVEMFKSLPEARARSELAEAARRFCKTLVTEDSFTQEYVAGTAEEIYPRIKAALPTGNLSGIFLSLHKTNKHLPE